MVKFRFFRKKADDLKLKDKLKNQLRNQFKGMKVNRGLVKSSKKVLLSPKNRKRILNLLVVASFLLVLIVVILEPPPKSELTKLLIYSKDNCESRFDEILTEIEQNPLNDLIGDNLPTSEEIFFAEWANDWFPRIDIPIVGSIVEEMGAEKVGDVDFDGLAPYGDLNMTIDYNPSNLSLEQCEAIWNPNDPYSFLVDWPDLWYAALENDQASINVLMVHFNLSYTQFDLIFDWLNTSIMGWMSNIKTSVLATPVSSIFLALAILAISVVACDYLYQRNYYLDKIRDKIKSKLEKRRANKITAEKLKIAKLKAEKIMAEKRRAIEKKKEEQLMLSIKKQVPFKSAIRKKTTLLQCPKCGGPRVVYYLKVYRNHAILKVTCPTDRTNQAIKLPLETRDQWIGEVADQIYRCTICGKRVQEPERIVFKDTWVVLFIKCPTHGMRNPKRLIPHTLYPIISEIAEQVAKPPVESKTKKLGGDEN